MSGLNHEIKCNSCNEWVVAESDVCPRCGAAFEHKVDEIEKEQRSKIDLSPKLIHISEDDHWLLYGIKKVVRFFQIIFYAILSFIIWFITMAAG